MLHPSHPVKGADSAIHGTAACQVDIDGCGGKRQERFDGEQVRAESVQERMAGDAFRSAQAALVGMDVPGDVNGLVIKEYKRMLKKNIECEASRMDDALIIMKKDDNSLHVLNEMAAFIWDMLEDKNVDEMVKEVRAKYEDAEEEMVYKDVNETIRQMLEKNIIQNIEDEIR